MGEGRGKGGKGQGGKLTIVIGIMVAIAIGSRGAVVPGAVMVALVSSLVLEFSYDWRLNGGWGSKVWVGRKGRKGYGGTWELFPELVTS